MAELKFPIEYTERVEVETDGTAPGTIVTVVGVDNARHPLACVAAFEGGGERLEAPGLDPADPEIITLKVRGIVRRTPPKEYPPPFDDGGLLRVTVHEDGKVTEEYLATDGTTMARHYRPAPTTPPAEPS